MKKSRGIGIIVCAVAICMALGGCSSGGSSTQSNSGGETQQATTQESNKSESDYAVTVGDCLVTQDYNGRDAIVVTYTFTNNSDKATSFFVAISAKAFQNGVQLDSAIVRDLNSQTSMSEIKPGATITVQEAYLLTDQTPVTAECTELISFNDDILAEKTFTIV